MFEHGLPDIDGDRFEGGLVEIIEIENPLVFAIKGFAIGGL